MVTDTRGARAPLPSDTAVPPGPPAGSLPWLLRRVSRRYRTGIADRLAEAGFAELPQPGYWALMVLARGATDAGQLTAEMDVSKQAISKLVETLVTSGYVDRKQHGSDRRRSVLALSAKGRAAARVIEEAARETDAAVAATLGTDHYGALVRTLSQLATRSGR